MLHDVQVLELGRGELDAAALARLQRVVSRSSFVAIDTEMGGISCQDSPRSSVMDSIDERYAQYSNSARQFPLVQFGLSVFTWDGENRVFRVETYQFPLFPVFHEKVVGFSHSNAISSTATANGTASACPDRRFLVQAKCLQYIRAHGFDLNAWIDKGIGHLSHHEQQQEPCKSALEKSARPEILRKFDPDQPALITEETQAFLDQLTGRLKQRLTAFEDAGREAAVGKGSIGALQDNGTRRRGRRGGKKNKKKNNGRNKRRDNRDRSTPPGSTTSSNLSAKEEPLEQPPAEEDLEIGLKEGEVEEEEALEEEDRGQQEEAGMPEEDLLQDEENVEPDEDIIAAMKRFLLAPVSSDPTLGPCGAYVTEPLAPFRRHALVQYLRKVLPDTVALDCKVDNADDEDVVRNPWRRRVRIVATRCKRQRQALMLADQQLADDEMRERNLSLIGFTAVLDAVVAARKPIVGHNMLLDLMQCYEKFHGPLPGRCAEFQRELHAWLGAGGGVFDTKTLVDYAMQKFDTFATHLAHTALENCFEVLSKHPFYGPEVQCTQPSVRGADGAREHRGDVMSSAQAPLQAHQAGYDAFMTGFVFLRVCSGLGVSNEGIAALGTSQEGKAKSTEDTLESLRNVLFVSHFLPTYVLNLPGPFPQPTPTPSRSRFVRMKLTRTRSPVTSGTTPMPNGGNNTCPALKTFHIKHCVGWALNLHSATRLVNVHWEGQQCVYVELPSSEAAEQLLAVRAQTKECWGSTNDPMPSIGCVDLERCPATYDCAEMEATATDSAPPPLAQQSTSDDEKTRRKRKSCEMAQ
ncbi:Poly(A)-specific ribonuclease PARN [Phytophthora citrophthora]|uniref:Poly(A)-specific ribonuclease PARN n=1 Tax=Phytophthora citrophthora TaxID=4793 RepID=A0AAD9GNU3_9STRA|nr:Poly(A)-specific ribonuclease PARN [Phytophthora citrophthora]